MASLTDQITQKYTQDDNESLDTVSPPIEPSVNIARDGLPIEVMNYVNDYNQQKEQEVNYVAGYGLGFTGEIGAGLALSYKLNSAGRYSNSVRNAKYIYNSIRGVQYANAASAPKSLTLPGAAVQITGFAATEAAIWATSNFFGQSIRKAYGVQDKIYAGELISTAVFGSIAQPIEKGMEGFKIGERLIKSTNWKISDGLVDLGAWKAREVVIKGVPKMVSGGTLGLAESALRQELAIQVFEDQESRNAWDYIISTGAATGINGMFGVFSKTGAWGRTQANTLSQRAVDRMDEAIELIQKDIDKLSAGRRGSRSTTVVKLKQKLKEHEDARAILQDNVEQFKKADEINTKVETEQPAQKPLDIDEKPPKPLGDEPEVEAPATPKDTPEATPAPDLPETRVTGEDGKPLIVYRGLRGEEGLTEGLGGRPASFTESKDIATIYSSKPNPDPFSPDPAKFTPTSNVNEVYLNIKKPLDFTNSGAEMDLGEYLDILGYGEKGGITDDEVVELLRYIQRRGRGKDAAKDNFKFELSELFKPKEGKPLDFSTDEFTPLDNLIDEIAPESRVDFTASSDDIREALLIDTFILADAPITKTVGQRLGNDGIVHIDAFGGSGEAPSLLGKKADDLDGLETEFSRYAEEQRRFPFGEEKVHITHRPFSENQVIPVSKTAKGKPAPAPKDTPVPTSKLDQEIEKWDKDWKKAVEGDVGSTVVENIIIRANKLFDNAIFNENVALRKMAGETIERKTLVEYREAVVTQIKLLNSVFAQLNSIGGRAVRANRTDLEQVVNRSVDSQNTAQLKESLNALKTRLDEILGGEADDFVPTITKILDEDDVTPTGKGEGIDSSATAKVQAALDKRIAKLQKQLDDLVNNKPKEEGKGKGSRTEDAQIAALKNSIKNVKKYIAENEKIIKLQKEADRLVEVSKRDAPDEMQGELKGSKRKPKPDEPSPEIKKLKGEIAAAKKYFRERLRNLAKTEQKALLNRDRLELYKLIRNYSDSEIAQNATNNVIKGIRGARLIRKTSLVASVTSVEAGFATGAIEVLKQYPRALATRILKRGKIGDKFMMHELEGASYAFQYILNKENRKQLGKHMSRAFKEGEDPMFDKSSRYMDDTPIDQQIMPRGTRKVMDKAIRDAEDAALGIEGINKFLKDNLRLGRFLEILSAPARGILAADSGFKKILFEQKQLVEFRQQGTLKFPNDPAKAKAYSDELFKNAFVESDGLRILAKTEEMEYDFMKITENLMMAAKSNNIEDVADNLIRQRLIEPIRKMMPDSDASIRGSLTSALLETIAFTFYKTAVYTATKSFTLANPLRVTGLKLNPYNKVISDLNRNVATERIAYKRFREQLKESPNEANTKRIKKEMADSNTRINEFNTRIDRAEKRKFKYNQEVLVDVMVQIGVGSMAFGAGYAGYATGSNAFLTDAQKQRNPNLARFQFMGVDYKAAAPIVFLVAIMSDLGRYTRELENKGKDGQPKNLSKKTTPLTVTIQSVVAAANEMPTNQVARDMKTFVSERSADVVAKWISSYVPNPQQVKKITRKVVNGDSIADLRGASFGERLVYGAFGAGNKKIRLNMMGEPETSSHTAWHTVNRYAGARQRPYEPWEELVAADKEAVIPIEPSSSLEGTNMKNFVDEDGIDLYYHFKLRVAKYGLQDIMNDYAKSVDTGQLQIEGDETINLGLQDFNNELRYHYKIIKEELLSDQRFLNKFIDENDKPILDYINESEEFMTIDPPKPMELKTFKDILPKF